MFHVAHIVSVPSGRNKRLHIYILRAYLNLDWCWKTPYLIQAARSGLL